MVTHCNQYRSNPPLAAICKEEFRRYHVTPEALGKAGGPLEWAVDNVYQEQAIANASIPCQSTRQNPKAFVRFLDRYVKVPLMEQCASVQQVKSEMEKATSSCRKDNNDTECTSPQLYKYKANAIKQLVQDEWKIQKELGPQINTRPERSIDQTIAVGRARCSEWSSLQMALATMAGIEFSAQILVDGVRIHIEPYLNWDGQQLWNLKLAVRTITNDARMISQNELTSPRSSRGEVVLAVTINQITSGVLPNNKKYAELQKLLFLTKSPNIQAWIEAALGDASLVTHPCVAADHYEKAVDLWPAIEASVTEDYDRATMQCSSG